MTSMVLKFLLFCLKKMRTSSVGISYVMLCYHHAHTNEMIKKSRLSNYLGIPNKFLKTCVMYDNFRIVYPLLFTNGFIAQIVCNLD